MSARDELYRRVVGAFVNEDRANALLDAYRAEVLTEADADTVRLASELHHQIDHQRASKGRWRARAEKAEELLRVHRAEMLANEESHPKELRKVAYLVAQPIEGRYLVESFVLVGEKCWPVNDTVKDAAELAEKIVAHFGRLGGAQ
jgi:hypothetical protein